MRSTFGRLDVVAANAGIAAYGGALDIQESEFQEVVDINMTGVWRTVKATVPLIIEGGRGGSVILSIRWVEAVDISNAVVWLASDLARFVTGVSLPVDAGYITKTF